MRVVLLALVIVFLNAARFGHGSQEQKLTFYQEKIKDLQQLILSRCSKIHSQKREINQEVTLSAQVAEEKLFYEKLLKTLLNCLSEESNNASRILTTSDSTTIPTPHECLTATNLTESWRMDHNGSDIRPGGPHSSGGYTCDMHKDLQWFRFSGAAGRRMLNKCPMMNSCGTRWPYWTDEKAPEEVGVPATINVYRSFAPTASCKDRSRTAEVMRCSLETNGLIYRSTDSYYDACIAAFCGMM
ncbi:oncoprotein-induced transcript 3 protein-like [Watersipora subatra]|uniref:oncoprotein-induced transcript 3 protein-like n=1 Tax=Watersipora subatra TaxID=2589382 RepID=UPI00355C1AE9